MNFETDINDYTQQAVIKVIGVGGAGNNALNRMIEGGLSGVDFIAINTDVQALDQSLANSKLQIGAKTTKGLGAGANPERGTLAAEENKEDIQRFLEDTDMLFITAGMGGGTGTGAAPIIAEIAQSMEILTVAIVTKPFSFEGKPRMRNAEAGIEKLKQFVDTIIVLPNQKLLQISKDMPYIESFKKADEVLYYATEGISSIITQAGYVNVDFSDVCTIMKEKGGAIMGTGIAEGDKRAVEAAQKAISSPLLDDISIAGAKGVLINIISSTGLTISEIEQANSTINEATGSEANVIFGTTIDESLDNSVRITVIATGFDDKSEIRQPQKEESKSKNPGIQTKIPFKETDVRISLESKKKFDKKRINQSNYSPEQYFQKYKTGTDLDIPAFLRKQMD